ncbi:MFS transporter [Dactylosporangium sp. McL0621]|uniref:MFS transporter n=1 Tax=Dactylosporangium sp. McL0621 TaxID=3415678 RepID=UPI003CF3F5AB
MSAVRLLAAAALARTADAGAGVVIVLAAVRQLGGPAQGSLVLAVLLVPHLVAGPLVGLVTDRARRPRLVHSGFVAGFGIAMGGILSLLGHVPQPIVLVLAVVAGCCGSMVFGGLSSRLDDVVAEPDRARFRGLDAATYNVADIFGPAAGAALAVSVGVAAAAAVIAAACLSAAVLLLTVRPLAAVDSGAGPVRITGSPGAGAGATSAAGRVRAGNLGTDGAGVDGAGTGGGAEVARAGGAGTGGGAEGARAGGAGTDGARAGSVGVDSVAAGLGVERVPGGTETSGAAGGDGASTVGVGGVPGGTETSGAAGGEGASTVGVGGVPGGTGSGGAAGGVGAAGVGMGSTAGGVGVGSAAGGEAGSDPRVSFVEDLRAGFRAIVVSRPLLAVTAASCVGAFGHGMMPSIAVLLGVAHGHPAGGGLLVTAIGLGALAGSLLMARRPVAIAPHRVVVGCLVVTGVVLASVPLVSSWAGVVGLFAVAGLFDGPLFTSLLQVRASEAPARARTQVFTLGAGVKLSAAAIGAAVFAGVGGWPLWVLLVGLGGTQVVAAVVGVALLAGGRRRENVRPRR